MQIGGAPADPDGVGTSGGTAMEHRPSAPTEPTAADDDVPLLPTAPPPPDRRGWRLVALASVPVLALAVLGLALAGGAPGDGTAPPEAVATVVPAAACCAPARSGR